MRMPYTLFPVAAITFATMAFGQANQFDSRIDSYVGLRYPCDGGVQPVLRVQNVGSETMTSCDIDVIKNGLSEGTFNWVLGVPAATNQFRQPALPPMSGVVPGDVLEFHILTVNGQADQGATENILQVPLTDEKGDAASYQAQVKVLTDDNPEETSWRLRDALGNTVAQSPVYTEAAAFTETAVTLSPDQCYNFEVFDSGNNGFGESRDAGYAKLMSLGADVAVATGNFGGLYRKVAETGSDDGCMPTQLVSTPDPVISCNTWNHILGQSTLYADDVPGANLYRFRFTNVAGQPAYARNITSPGRALPLNKWYTLPLKPGRTYHVQIQASFNNGATYCAYGPQCLIHIGYPQLGQGEMRAAEAELLPVDRLFSVFPNPSADGRFNLRADGFDAEEPLNIEVLTLQGARKAAPRTIVLAEEGVQALALDRPLESGMYILRITVGGSVTTERLIVR
ncbi:MAG: T9SS type A sorting domain-containing protein [Bacteroidetes bacterium]|nr:T9SS type A sorting domain-containing protein [Bacteroidota bacterium]MCC6654115.1 T9SS type A sorting domain-containing protein [Flavobacteriales bacterium]HMU13891.1 T9SS type A sorting domain-containing protein [Flavobacteriales bacterium]